jgi:hypothetical protein
VLQPLLKALPQRLTGPGVPRQLERGFLGEDGAGRLVLVRLDSALEADPGDWRPLVLGSGKDWDQLGRGINHSINHFCGSALVSMRIRIQHFLSMRIRIRV